MKQKKIVLLTMLALSPLLSLKAQQSGDWGSSFELTLSKKLYKGISLSLSEEYRTRENFGTTDRFSHTLGVDYQLCNYLKLGGAYNLINYNHPTKSWEIRHRYYFYAVGSYSLGGFTASLRERFQSTYREGVEETSKRANPKLYLRSRLQLEYNITSTSFTPYTSVELFNSLNNPKGNSMDQVRLIGGVEYKLNKRNSFDVYYRYANKIDEDASVGSIIGVGFKHKF
jgi:hypothetical protein